FYASRLDKANQDPWLQNFYYKGETRGFFQNMERVMRDGKPVYLGTKTSDRWAGDMAWLLYPTLYYEKLYGAGHYDELKQAMLDLLKSWYKDSPDGLGGYIQHGWRKGDKQLHETFGHEEGNIDMYALFTLVHDDALAAKIKTWLDHRLRGKTLPLDLYTWRALAFGKEAEECLNIPDFDFRYRKTVTFNGKTAVGPYSSCVSDVNNIWLDGLGHIACAYFSVGNVERGNFYANQMDAFLLDRDINGVKVRGLPFTANKDGVYSWVDPDRGFVSVAAWYIFAKNRFNPMLIEKY
ncbi:MAG: hypothetical protein V2A34_10840, partial [Lentisphaerota bacterium]